VAGTGIDREAGSPLTGFEHVRQSIGVILTTPIGARVMRRDFGSELFDLIDRPMTDRVILAAYAAVAMAIARWEPRFALTRCALSELGPGGGMRMDLEGIYYPRGHLGDFTAGQDASGSFVFGKARLPGGA
jgi:phage baseplate assembly protein W